MTRFFLRVIKLPRKIVFIKDVVKGLRKCMFPLSTESLYVQHETYSLLPVTLLDTRVFENLCGRSNHVYSIFKIPPRSEEGRGYDPLF